MTKRVSPILLTICPDAHISSIINRKSGSRLNVGIYSRILKLALFYYFRYDNEHMEVITDFASWKDGNTNIGQFSKAENEELRARVVSDGNLTEVKTASRIEGILIPNSIFTSSFNAKLETNCPNPSSRNYPVEARDRNFSSYSGWDKSQSRDSREK